MKNNILQQWIPHHKQVILKTKAIMARMYDICHEPSSKIDTLSLEILASNLIAHLDQVSQYTKCIDSLYDTGISLPPNLKTQYLTNKKEIDTMVSQYNDILVLINAHFDTLQTQFIYTQQFVSQLA